MTAALVLAAVVAVVAVLLVAVPFLREPVPADDHLREPKASTRIPSRSPRSVTGRSRR